MLAKIDKEKLRKAPARQNYFNLSELAREVQVTPTTIYRLMQGGKGVRFVTLKKLAAALNVGMYELLEGMNMYKINVDKTRSLLFERELSIREFAKEAGLHEKTARKFYYGGKVNLKIIGKVAQYFGVDGNELITEE